MHTKLETVVGSWTIIAPRLLDANIGCVLINSTVVVMAPIHPVEHNVNNGESNSGENVQLSVQTVVLPSFLLLVPLLNG